MEKAECLQPLNKGYILHRAKLDGRQVCVKSQKSVAGQKGIEAARLQRTTNGVSQSQEKSVDPSYGYMV